MQFSFLIGTHRSGTTWLGGLLGESPDVAYWVEPRQVWTYRNWFEGSDRLTEENVTEPIRKHIRKRFETYALEHDRQHFIEKTPSNCFRVPFMRQIFPEAKFILLIRDGRAVVRSTDEIMAKGPDNSRIVQRIKESTLGELPAIAMRIPWLVQKVLGRRVNSWGVHPPGWRDWPSDLNPLQSAARQWSESINAAVRDFRDLPERQKTVLRYEDLVLDPEKKMNELIDFLGLSHGRRIVALAQENCRPESIDKWRNVLSEDELESIEPIVRETLEALGYSW